MYYDEYPIGDPKKIFKPCYSNKKWFGLTNAVLAPQNLHIPILLVKVKMD